MIIHLLAYAPPSPAPGAATQPPDWCTPLVIGVLLLGIIIALVRTATRNRGEGGGGNTWY